MDIKGKSVLITGAKRVGRAVAYRMADSGANVAVHYNSSAAEAESLAVELREKGVRALTVKADVSDAAEVETMVERVTAELGSLDVLVAMASVFRRTPFSEITMDDWDAVMNVDLKGTFLCARAAARVMLKQGGGKIITIGDWAALRPYRNYLPYLVAKGGVLTMTKALARELAPTIQVNAILPGPVLLPDDYSEAATERIIEATPLKRLGSPEDIAAAVSFLVEGSDFITGAFIPVDGGRSIG